MQKMVGNLKHLALTTTLLLTAISSFLSVDADAAASSPTADIDNWIYDISKSYKLRQDEITKGVGTELDPELQEAEKDPKVIKVSQDGSGDFAKISHALASIPTDTNNTQRVIIKIGRGVYKEKINVERLKHFITFYGEAGDNMPTISSSGTAAEFGTWNSATVAVESNYFMAVNIIFMNAAPMPAPGVNGGQAVAMRISGDKAAFYNCRFLGYQDTLCDDIGRHFFKDCFIQGMVDFVFGNGRSIYVNCELHSLATGIAALTAQAKANEQELSGFSFVHCNITGSGNVLLSRAWKARSTVVFSYCYMGTLVNPDGWDDKGYKDRDKTVYYAEYKCQGPGAATGKRVKFAKELSTAEAKPFLSLTFIHAKTWLLPQPKL